MSENLYRTVDQLPSTCLDYLVQALELDGKEHTHEDVLREFAGTEFVPEDFELGATWDTLANPD